jgi:hypothetical protein
MAHIIYDSAFKELVDGTVAYLTDTIKIMLVTSSYTVDRVNHTKRSDITNEVSGTGYTSGGFTLGTKTITKDTTNHRAVFGAATVSADPITFTGATQAIIYKSTGVAANDNLIAKIDLGATFSPVAGPFNITWNASGEFYLGQG